MEKTNAIKLLAIDDKPDNLTALSAVVRAALPQAIVLTATDGSAGIELAVAEDPDMIFLDIFMDGMDSLELCRLLKADARTKVIPVVFLAALNTDPAIRVNAVETGAEGFLTKPLETVELSVQIKAMAKVKVANRSQRSEQDRLEARMGESVLKPADEAALRQVLMEQSRDGIVIIDQDGQVYECNRKFAEMLGYPHDAMIRLNVTDWEFLHPREHIQEMIRCVDEKGDHFETVHRRMDGSLYDVEISTNAAWFSGKKFILCVCRDISKRKKIEKNLIEIKELRDRAESIAHVGSWNLDLITNKLYWSDEVYRIFGCKPQEFVATYQAFLEFTHPDDRAAVDEAYSRSVSEGSDNYEIEHRTLRQGTGEIRHVHERCVHVRDDAGAIIQSIGMVHDITERKQAEELSSESAKRAKRQRDLIAQLTFSKSIVNNSIDDALKILSSELAATLKVDRVSVWLLSEDETTLQRLALYDAGTGLYSHIEVLNTADIPSYFEALRKDSQVDAEDAQNDPRTKELTCNYFVPLQISALLDSAIQQNGRLIGVLSAEHRGPVREWLADEKSFLSAITYLVAQLLANAERRLAEEALRESEATIRKKLKSIVEPEGDISTLELSDILDIEVMQPMLEEFYRATGMLGAVLDLTGKVLVAFGWQDICTKFHRCHPDTAKNCLESDTVLTQGVPPGTFRAYHCKNNMWDMVTPLMVGDQHVGNVFFGQFFYEDETPDVELFRTQARQHGFDETEYLAALARVPRLSREKVDAGMQFYARLATIVTTLSYNAIKQARMIAERERLHKELAVLNAELELKVEQRTAQLEASNKELEAFSYSVSHDLRAPLRHINGYVDLLNNRFREALPEKAGHYLNQVTDSAEQMGTLIDDLLQFSRTGRQELRQADLDMNTVVQEALEKLKPDTKNRNISWTVAQLPQVYGDYALLQQVWINLLSNAVKYTQYKDQATIEVGFTREPAHWVFFVRDNGVGFDMQYAHKLFGVFQRLHSPAQFEGTGIGLANVQRIVLKHGGQARAEAQPEKGATFYFTLPEKSFANGGTS